MGDLAKGGCLCGDYSYQFSKADVASAFHCHCKDCRRSTGSGKATIVLVPTAALRTEGELKTYTVQGTEGASVTRGFCPNCGSQLISNVEEMPAMRMVKAGTLDDSSWVKVAVSCWSDSAEPWSPVDATSPVAERNPTI